MSPKDVLIADVQESNNDTAIAVTATNGKRESKKLSLMQDCLF